MFPSVVVGNIFLHLRQSKLLSALSRRCGERRSPFLQGWKLLPFYLNCTFLGVTGGGAEGDEDTVRKEAKITFRRDKCPDYITRFKKAMTSIFFFLQEKIIWISILFPVSLLSLLLFPISSWKQFALILFTNILKFHYYVLILSKSEIIWLGLGLSLSWDNEQSICLTN